MSIYMIEDHLKEARNEGRDYDVTFTEQNRDHVTGSAKMHVRDLDSGQTMTYLVTSVLIGESQGPSVFDDGRS